MSSLTMLLFKYRPSDTQIPLETYRENLRRELDSFVRRELAKKGKHGASASRPNVNLYTTVASSVSAIDDDDDIELPHRNRRPIARLSSDKVRPVTVKSSNGDSKTFSLPPAIKLEKEPLLGRKDPGWKPKSRYSGYGST